MIENCRAVCKERITRRIDRREPQFFAAVDLLPPGLVKSIRQNLERLTQRAAQSRDGLQWIETSDPRSRKADKLPVLSQGDKKGG